MQGTNKNCKSNVRVSLPYHKLSISSMYSQGRVTMNLKIFRLDPSYKHNLFLFSLSFSKFSTYMMLRELPLWKISFWIPPTFSLSQNLRYVFLIYRSKLFHILANNHQFSDYPLYCPLGIVFSLRRPTIMVAIYWCFPLWSSSSSLLLLFSS